MPTESGSLLDIRQRVKDLYRYLGWQYVRDLFMQIDQRAILEKERSMADMFNKEDGGSLKRLSASSRVLEIIEAKHEDVFESAAEAKAGIELKKRSEGIALMLEIHDNLRKDLNKMGPDIAAQFDEHGAETSPSRWSKSQLDKKAKLMERIAKGGKAFEKAKESKDFTDVYNWNNSNKPGKPADKSGGDNSETNG